MRSPGPTGWVPRLVRQERAFEQFWTPARGADTPQLTRDLLCDTPPGGNDGLSRDFCSARTTPDLRPRPPGVGTADHSHARILGQPTPLRPSISLPVAAAPDRVV